MTRKEVIYRNLLALLEKLTQDGDVFQEYYNQNISSKQEELVDISERIQTHIKSINGSANANSIYGNFDVLNNDLHAFLDSFLDYPNHRINEILFIISLISKINEEIGDELQQGSFNFEEDVNTTIFCLAHLNEAIHQQNYTYYDTQRIANSLVLFSIHNVESFILHLSENPIPTELILQLLAKIGNQNDSITANQSVLISTAVENLGNTIKGCVYLHLVKQGYLIHEPLTYSEKPKVEASRTIIVGNKYQQFHDSLIILSEYNSQTDILDKYLRIYQLIENFMFKYPVVSLERLHSGKPFSIRDFQMIYKKIDMSEISALKAFIDAIFNKEYRHSSTFSSFVLESWKSLHHLTILSGQNVRPKVLFPTFHKNKISDKNKINITLSLLKIKNKRGVDLTFDDIKADNINSFFSQLVYSFRNSIVHFRETEFHLNNETLINHNSAKQTSKEILEFFLIPVLEEISYYLIIEPNDIVWYEDSKIQLWKND